MTLSKDRIARVTNRVAEAVRLERALAARLADQADVLRRGAVGEIHAASAALDDARRELAEVADAIRQEWHAAAGDGAPLAGLLDALPDDVKDGVRVARDELVWNSRKNAAFARAALDALADVKTCVARAAAGETGAALPAGSALDAHA